MFGHDDDNQQQQGQTDNNPVLDQPASRGMLPEETDNQDSSPNSSGSDTDAGNFMMDNKPTEDGTSPPLSGGDESHHSPTTSAPSGSSNDLLDIKQQALQQLGPLVGHLDQTPEEKFRTIMMMIQASDNQDLIKEAYKAAQDIDDEKARAQALLDIVNEINYFTQAQHEQ